MENSYRAVGNMSRISDNVHTSVCDGTSVRAIRRANRHPARCRSRDGNKNCRWRCSDDKTTSTLNEIGRLSIKRDDEPVVSAETTARRRYRRRVDRIAIRLENLIRRSAPIGPSITRARGNEVRKVTPIKLCKATIPSRHFILITATRESRRISRIGETTIKNLKPSILSGR